MKSAIVVALCATAALSKPLVERAYEFKWDMTTVTVTADGSVPTGRRHLSGDYRQFWKISSRPDLQNDEDTAPVATTEDTTPAAVVVPVQPAYGRPSTDQTTSTEASSDTSSDTSSTEVASTPSKSNLGGYEGPILDAHNVHRANHSVPDLTWSDSLASIAAQIAATCVYGHDTKAGGGGYGQNIGAGTKPEEVNGMITNAMYNGEINDYPGYGREPTMGNFAKWGHYSQIIWKSTTEVGCATQYCPGGLGNTGSGISPYFTVCNYSPPGNFGGQYAANVLQPKGNPTVTV